MVKARRQIQEKLKLIDIVFELLDARVPLSSRNPMIDDILKGKPRLVLLNKADLADPAATRAWSAVFQKDRVAVLPVDALSGYQVKEIVPQARCLLFELQEKWRRKGIQPRAVRALIVGIPNVGKSTLINRLAGRRAAATGDRPGITKGQQWIKVGKELELLDTPGILWPKFDDESVGLKLAAIGSIREEILNPEDIAFFVLRELLARYPERLKERYDLPQLPGQDAEAEPIVQLMEEIGRKRGCLQSGGTVNLEKASQVILRDLRTGKLGRISLETP
jgi:ribosome biogenesis GTPase A